MATSNSMSILARALGAALLATITLAACTADPEYRERRREELAIWKAEFRDFKTLCHREGGYVVQYPPEIGGRYRCAK